VTTILAFLFVLGVLVFVHELGHFLAARRLGIRVITFSLGFGPKLLTTHRDGVEYAISAIPLGGYVKMAGESVEETRTGAPDEFLSKSKWERFQVLIMGPVMNIALALVLTTLVLFQGADVPLYQSSAPVIGQVAAGSPAEKAGLQRGDRIQFLNGKTVKTWDEVALEVLPKAGRQLPITVERAGQAYATTIVPASQTKYEIGDIGVAPMVRPQVAAVQPGTPAAQAGLQTGDVFVAVDGQTGLSQPDLIKYIRAHGTQAVTFQLERAGAPFVELEPAGERLDPHLEVLHLDAKPGRLDDEVVHHLVVQLVEGVALRIALGFTFGHARVQARLDVQGPDERIRVEEQLQERQQQLAGPADVGLLVEARLGDEPEIVDRRDICAEHIIRFIPLQAARRGEIGHQ